MKVHPNRSLLVGITKKVVPAVALTFFLCLTLPSFAITNSVTGTAYGTDYATLTTATSISTISNGIGSLTIGYSETTNISFNHEVSGFIDVTNNFDQFTINGGTSSITNHEFAVLFVSGGSNLHLNGGSYIGTARDVGFVLPPIPGQPTQTNLIPTASAGGIINQTENVIVNGANFSGSALKASNGNVIGFNGLGIIDSSITFTTNGTANSTLRGGNASAASPSSSIEAFSTGGDGLYGIRSDIVISNGTFRGGNSGAVSALGGNSATSMAGNGITAVSTSDVVIVDGTFSGGIAGSATSGSGSTLSQGGAGLELQDRSSAAIHGGTFSGNSGAPAVRMRDSDITTFGGNFSAGGLYSESTGGTNQLDLLGGSFNRIQLFNATNGLQLLTINSNLVVSGFTTQDGGTVVIDNQSNVGLQRISLDSGIMTLSNDYALGSSGIINFKTGILDVDGSITMGSGSAINVDVIENKVGMITADKAYFETNSSLSVDASLAGFSAGTNEITLVSTTGGIFVFDSGVSTNTASPTNFAQYVNLDTSVTGRTAQAEIQIQGNNDLVYRFFTQSLREYWNVDSQFGDLADELDEINNTVMMATIDSMAPEDSKAAVAETYFSTLNTMQTSLQGLNAALGQTISRGTEFRESLKLPTGANGPEESEDDWRFWAKYYGQFYTHDSTKDTAAYDSTLHGGVLGMDKCFGNLLIGLSGGAGNYHIDSDNDSEQDLNAGHGALYTTLGKELSYLDAGIAYGYSKVESETGGPFVLDGEFDTHLISGYIGGGIGFEFPNIGTIITPEVSAQYSSYRQDAYEETSTTAVPRSFDEFDADSLRSSLGLNIAMLNTKALETFGFKIEGRFHWLREFNAEPGDLSFQLEGGANNYQIAYPALDEDIFRAGVGFTFFNTTRTSPKNVMLRVDFDELFGENFNSHNLSAKAIYAF
jgi:hypothetical protein